MIDQERLQEKYRETETLLKEYMGLKQKARVQDVAEACKDCKTKLRTACEALVEEAGYASAPDRLAGELEQQMQEAVRKFFRDFELPTHGKVTETGIRSFLGKSTEGGALSDRMIRHIVLHGTPPDIWLLHAAKEADSMLVLADRLLHRVREKAGINTRALINRACSGYAACTEDLMVRVRSSFTDLAIASLLAENKALGKGARAYLRSERERNKVKNGLLDAIPQTYPELFPLARQKQRRFILHIGPTNSGKSYDAINALKECASGIYLAPLRLLAYEKFEELNDAGCPCTLKTGEEEIGIPFSYLQSSTIEVLDFTKEYDVAVIDEAQMIADSQRGSAWTFALLGVRADTVHVCLAPEAEMVVKNVIEACGDTWEVVHHRRLVPLSFDEKISTDFKKEARRGTAFIVFSRKDVHAVAGELQRAGFRCSVIYGALPYDVRRNEVKRYTSGETDIVVATDAIGMGLNLPIERVIFLVTEKFDGSQQRPLSATEIKQIGGRAGRFGMFEHGFVGSVEEKKMVRSAIYAKVPQIREARIGFPYTLTGVAGSISQLMSKWCEIRPKPGFENADLSIEIALAEELEKETSDKELVYRFVMIPFDEKNEVLKELWKDLFRDELSGRRGRALYYLPAAPSGKEPLDALETRFKACDMLYHYIESSDMADPEDLRTVLLRKNEISSQIMAELSRQKLSMKKCKICGKELPFRYKFSVCEECFAKGRKPYYGGRRHTR